MTTLPDSWTGKMSYDLLPEDKRNPPPEMTDQVSFGSRHANHMVVVDYSPEKGWLDASIQPFGPIPLYPDSVVFHYGQQIFEGLKAYRGPQDEIFLFRPDRNADRFYKSAVRLAMAPVPQNLFLRAISELVQTEADWILPKPWSLYIRPFLIPTERGVALRASKTYRFYVLVCAVKEYYSKPEGVAVFVERDLVRAAPGGVGEAKCGGNYAASLFPMAKARSQGAEQVLWLDARERRYIEEVGAMNIMFAYGKHIVTPRLSGSILPGVTRDSILRLAPDLGFTIEERSLALDEILRDLDSGAITECFGCGTAAVVSRVEKFIDRDIEHPVAPPPPIEKSVAHAIKSTLTGIQWGTAPDPYGWRVSV